MAVTLDLGLEKNIHPPDKQTVGARLAQTALGTVYGRKVESASPEFQGATIEEGRMRAWISHAEDLHAEGGPIGDFEVAAENLQFVPAAAKIEMIAGRPTIVAGAASVPAPKYIRYGWASAVRSYLYNSSGLPMGTFTSESDASMLTH